MDGTSDIVRTAAADDLFGEPISIRSRGGKRVSARKQTALLDRDGVGPGLRAGAHAGRARATGGSRKHKTIIEQQV